MKVIEEIRQSNLRDLLEEQFDGDIKRMADTLPRGLSTIRKYLSASRERTINTSTARVFERSLNLENGYLDSEYHGNNLVYFVTLKVSRNFTYEVVKSIKDHSEAVECFALLGEFDVMIKVEVKNYHELQIFYDKISRLPGVQRTRTYPAVDTIRWQHPQPAFESLKDPNTFTNYADMYKHQLILDKMEEIRELENGRITSKDNTTQGVDLSALMMTVKTEYCAIRLHDETYPNEKDYLLSEKERIANNVVSKRIMTLPESYTIDPMQSSAFQSLLETAQAIIDIGCRVKFLFIEDWIYTSENVTPECFSIVDNQFIYLKMSNTRSQLLTRHADLNRYRHAFKVNWDRSVTMDKLLLTTP